MLAATPEYFFGGFYLFHYRGKVGSLVRTIAIGLIAAMAA